MIPLPSLVALAGRDKLAYEAFQTISRLGLSKADLVGIVASSGPALILPPATVQLANGVNTDIVIPSNTFIRIAGPSAVFSISGIAGGVDGRVLILYNTAVAFNMTLNNASGSLQNRIIAPGSPIVAACILIYDAVLQYWRLVAYT